MADEVENHTIRLLQEMRSDFNRRLDHLESEVTDMRADLTNRLDGNTLLLNLVAGMLHNHEERINVLEKSGG